MKLYCVCQYCQKQSDDTATLEINFSEGKMYYVCPNCKKMNEMVFRSLPKPLPRVRRM